MFRNIYGRLFFLTFSYRDEDADDDKADSYIKSHTQPIISMVLSSEECFPVATTEVDLMGSQRCLCCC